MIIAIDILNIIYIIIFREIFLHQIIFFYQNYIIEWKKLNFMKHRMSYTISYKGYKSIDIKTKIYINIFVSNIVFLSRLYQY